MSVSYAQLIGPLSIGGSLKTDGTPNVNGIVWFYAPGTTTPATVYADPFASVAVTAPVTLDAGGRIPYATYPNGIYTKQPIRLLIQDSTGQTTVSDTTFQTTAGATGLNNIGFPNETTVDQMATALYASLGGIDGQFSPFVGATPLPVYKVISGIQLTPQMFGAKGDGLNDDTTAIQAAVNKVIALGGGVVFLPPGTYKISSALTAASPAGLSIVGTGAANVRQTNASADAFTITSATSLFLAGFNVSHASTSSGNGITLSQCTSTVCERVTVAAQYTIGMYSSGNTSNQIALFACNLRGTGGSGRGFKSETPFTTILGGAYGGGISGAAMEFALACGSTVVCAATFDASIPTGILFNANLTGTRFAVSDCPSLDNGISAPFDLSGLSTNPKFRQVNNNVEGSTYSAAIGNTLTPLWQRGNDAILVAASGGAGTQTVAAPTPTPAVMGGQYFTTHFKNASGGAVTWSLNAVFVPNTTIPTTDGHTITVGWYWDNSTSKYREMFRQDTVT